MFQTKDSDLDENFWNGILMPETEKAENKTGTSTEHPRLTEKTPLKRISQEPVIKKAKSPKPKRTLSDLSNLIESCNNKQTTYTENDFQEVEDKKNGSSLERISQEPVIKKVKLPKPKRNNKQTTDTENEFQEVEDKKKGSSLEGQNSSSFQLVQKRDLSIYATRNGNEKKPVITPVSTPTFGERKFPGPAGILPDKVDLNIDLNALIEFDISSTTCKDLVPFKKSTEVHVDPFMSPAWLQFQQDLSDGDGVEVVMPEECTLAWLKKMDTQKKISFIGVLIKSIDHRKRHPRTVVIDRTGEMKGAIMDFYLEYQKKLVPGSVLALKNVGVLNIGKKHYLMLSKRNLVCIYENNQTNQTKYVYPKHQEFEYSLEEFESFKRYKCMTVQKRLESNEIVTTEDLQNRRTYMAISKFMNEVLTRKRKFEPVTHTSQEPETHSESLDSTTDNADESEENILEGIDPDELFDDILV